MNLIDLEIERITDRLSAFTSKMRYPIIEGQLVKLSYSIHSHSITIFENRSDPYDPKEIKAFPIATIRYFESRDCWQVDFLNEDFEWHVYEPEQFPEARCFEEALELIHVKLKMHYA